MMRTAIVALMLGAGLTSCASFKKEQSGAELRKEGYEALLKTVKPGMYRRQLYAVLPPCEKPMALSPQFSGRLFSAPIFNEHMEWHRLDEECLLQVRYQLKDQRDYPSRTGSFPKTRALDPRSTVNEGPKIPEGKRVPSKENPDDILTSISSVQLSTGAQDFPVITVTTSPWQETGNIYGRKPLSVSGEDFPFIYPQGTPAPFAEEKPKSVSDRPPLP